jgi:methionyl aminopeptidase
MQIILKTMREIEAMRRAGALAAAIVEMMRQRLCPGISTIALDDLVRIELSKAGAISTLKNLRSPEFPGHCCICINDEVLHAPPGSRVVHEGDVVTLDVGVFLEGYCASRALTVPVGSVDAERARLLRVTEQTLAMAIDQMKPGEKWSEIARLIQQNVESNGYNVVREFVGHGIGKALIENPPAPNFYGSETVRRDFRLRPGMTLTVEPIVLSGSRDIYLLADGFTVVTRDSMPAAHVRHTVAITGTGVDVLTKLLAEAG